MPKSIAQGIHWPAIPGNAAASMLAIQYQLEQSQWCKPEQLLKQQLAQLSPLVTHAAQTVPFYRDFYHDCGFKPESTLNPDNWVEVPIITRKQLQDAEKNLLSEAIPASHGKSHTVTTSGSTGMSITIHATELSDFFWRAFTLRDHLWHNRDFQGKMAVIRRFAPSQALPPNGEIHSGWGPSVNAVYSSGPLAMLNITASVEQQLAWLQQQDPAYLLSYPSNLLALANLAMQTGVLLPELKEIRTLGEVVGEEVRVACKQAWGAPLVDQYSCQETGYLALQCPEHEHYHLQSESALIEVLNDEYKTCMPGEIGRVVVTTLHNYATPLIRYEIGDYAQVGEPCSCGRGLPVLTRILGRTRNMLHLPNGDTRWPLVGSDNYRCIAPVSQFQLIQHTLEQIEVKLVMPGKLTPQETLALSKMMHSALGYPFALKFTYVDAIPRSVSGKHEDFISMINV